ncbi:MAG: fumarylacetoacetase [Gemmatimonadota bacterium]|nr:fumarylacetoacetase [Gemmatimonadota bacterium]
MNHTHDPRLRCWVSSANAPDGDFPIQNLPFGVFSQGDGSKRIGIAIGDSVLDVGACGRHGLIRESRALEACDSTRLNELMSLPSADVSELRAAASELLSSTGEKAEAAKRLGKTVLGKLSDCRLWLPAEIGDYTDFYASVHHATNVGSMFRPDQPLLPNYKYVPIGYHGRSSSLVPSGTAVRRPRGQAKSTDAPTPEFASSKMLDYESELGFFIGRGTSIGESLTIDEASDTIFGFCLVNDWSARDIQAWEYQPLGPFLAKNFATSLSPWVVTAEAVAPYRVPAAARPPGDPDPLPYLRSDRDAATGGLAVTLEVYLRSPAMAEQGSAPMLLSSAPFSEMYWSVAQMVAHHSSNGCNLRSGDLMASGTVSGPTEDSLGCLLELTRRGARPIALPTGEQRKFLEDGDEVIMRGYLVAPGAPRIGFGECTGTILPSGTD